MIDKVSIPVEEQETSITVDVKKKQAYIYSSTPCMIKLLYRIIEQNPNDARIEKDDRYGLSIIVPSKWIKIKPPTKRFYTEEQKQEIAARLNVARRFGMAD